MDEKHRQYCIKLGNPYMQDDRYRNNNIYNQTDNFWDNNPDNQNKNWLKSSNKFTN